MSEQSKEKYGISLDLIEAIEKKGKDFIDYCLLQFHIVADNLWSAYVRDNDPRADTVVVAMRILFSALR